MTTPIDRKRALPGNPFRSGAWAVAVLIAALAAGVACSPQPQTPPAATGPAAPSPDLVPIETPAPPPAAEPAPPPAEASAPPPPAAPTPEGEPVMEWREGRSGREAVNEEVDKGGKHVFTNADLARFAKPEDTAGGEAAAQARQAQEAFDKAALKRAQEQPATDEWKARTRAEAEERVRTAEARLDALRRLSQSDANPLLPQPRLSAEEEKKREGLSRDQRYKMTQQEILAAEQELADARAALAKVEKNLAPPR